MSPWRHDFLAVGISNCHIALRAPNGTISLVDGGVSALMTGDEKVIPATSARQWRVVVANDMARHWLVTPPSGLLSLLELKAFVDARFQALFGGRADDWSITADWHASQPFLCAAIPRRLTDPLTELGRTRMGAVTYTTSASQLLRRGLPRLPSNGWCAFRTSSSLFVFYGLKGRMVAFRLLPVAQGLSAAERQSEALTEVQRAVTRSGFQSEGAVMWLDPSGTAAQALAKPIAPLENITSGGFNLPHFDGDASEAELAASLA